MPQTCEERIKRQGTCGERERHCTRSGKATQTSEKDESRGLSEPSAWAIMILDCPSNLTWRTSRAAPHTRPSPRADRPRVRAAGGLPPFKEPRYGRKPVSQLWTPQPCKGIVLCRVWAVSSGRARLHRVRVRGQPHHGGVLCKLRCAVERAEAPANSSRPRTAGRRGNDFAHCRAARAGAGRAVGPVDGSRPRAAQTRQTRRERRDANHVAYCRDDTDAPPKRRARNSNTDPQAS